MRFYQGCHSFDELRVTYLVLIHAMAVGERRTGWQQTLHGLGLVSSEKLASNQHTNSMQAHFGKAQASDQPRLLSDAMALVIRGVLSLVGNAAKPRPTIKGMRMRL
jgi:hypothetical protein